MTIHLVVTRQFGPHKPGDRIEDEAVIAGIRDSSNHANVVAVSAPAKPAEAALDTGASQSA
jgi:hypothetical protein